MKYLNLNNSVSFIVGFTLVFAGLFVLATPAQADCSYNGYVNSNGKCAVSYSAPSAPRYYDDDDDYYDRYRERNEYRYRYTDRDQQIFRLIELLEAMIKRLQDRIDDNVTDSQVNVTTRSADDVDENSATLRGRIDLNREEEAEVWFEYGTSRTNLNKDTDKEDIHEDDDSRTFSAEIDDLNDDDVYYFRAMAEDDDGDEDRGVILSFRTDEEDDNNDDPELNTNNAEDIQDDSAELHGSVDMNDFDNGQVFFVYGEDEDLVENIAEDHDEYSDIDEDGDNLQKVVVDNDLDKDDEYSEDVTGLDNDTEIFYSICVEYEDDDGDQTLACGDVERFTTEE